MDKRYSDLALILRLNKEASPDLESRVRVDHITRDLVGMYTRQDPEGFDALEFQDAAGMYLPLLLRP